MVERLSMDAARAKRGLVLLMALHVVLLVWAANWVSVTFDEFAHLPAGFSYWHDREFEVYNLSPPLLRLVGSLPAYLMGANAPPLGEFREQNPSILHWNYAHAFLVANSANYQRIFVAGRLMMIPISCLGLWIVWRWAAGLYGPGGGVISAMLYALCPNICAHASLVATDAGTTVFMAGTVWLWWRFCDSPSWKRCVVAGVFCGLAQLCKFTALLLWPVMVAVAIVALFRRADVLRHTARLVVGCAASVVISILLINLCYGFEGSLKPLSGYSKRLPDTPTLLPRDYVEGFLTQKKEIELKPMGYLLGKQYAGARWGYYPVVLAWKLPLGTICLALLGAVSFAFGGRSPITRGEWSLVAALAVVGGASFSVDLNIGVRYILPIFPLAFVLMGRVALFCAAAGAVKWRVWVVAISLGLLAAENLWAAPRYISFFNVLTGGPTRAYRVINDSNVDWGQSLFELKRWMNRNGVDRVGLAYFGRVDPGVYGIDYVPLNQPNTERYAVVSVYYLVGMVHRLATHDGFTPPTKLLFYRQLQGQKPVAVIGETLFVFTREQMAQAAREARLDGDM